MMFYLLLPCYKSDKVGGYACIKLRSLEYVQIFDKFCSVLVSVSRTNMYMYKHK